MTKISYEDIRVGDTIRATKTHEDGEQNALTGKVIDVRRHGIQTNHFLFSVNDSDVWEYDLLERPLDKRQIELAKNFLVKNFGYIPDSSHTDTHAARFIRAGVIFPEVSDE